jgi:probable F420-dependent oxidoreductase
VKIRFAVAPVGPRAAQLGADGLEATVDALESSEFDSLWLSDVTLGPVTDPLVGLAFAAGKTRRLKLGANLIPLGRNPFLLAKALAQLDRLSGGRLLLSFVPGLGQPGERAALGVKGVDRGTLLEESLELVRSWWRGDAVSTRSSAWAFDGQRIPLLPAQQPLEVWLGGASPRALDRVGRVADGWLAAAVTPEESMLGRRAIEEAAARSERSIDPEHFGISIPLSKEAPEPSVLEGIRSRRPGVDPEAIVPVGAGALRSMILRYIDAGLSKFVLRPLDGTTSKEDLAWLADAVLDLQS